jgi:thioredoxin reductase (NADPH)
MSQYLIREIEAAPNIEVCYRTEVAGGGRDGRLEQLRLRHRDTGDTETEPADGLLPVAAGSRWLLLLLSAGSTSSDLAVVCDKAWTWIPT